MNKKGFTLVELMAVIILLGVITLIAYPIVTTTIDSSREKAYEETVRQIEQAASRYGLANANVLPKKDGIFDTTIRLQDLVKAGYIKKTENGKLYNPIDSSEMTGCIDIKYDTEYSQYIYTYDAACADQEIIDYANYYINYGGVYNDYFSFVLPSLDGGYVAIGTTNSPSVNNKLNHDQTNMTKDGMIVKYNSKGQIVWDNTFGGSLNEWADSATVINENGQEYYIVTGWGESSDGDLQRVSVDSDRHPFIFKYDINGNIVTKKIFNNESARITEIRKIEDGYIVLGWHDKNSNENDEILSKVIAGSDIHSAALIMKLDNNFNVVWSNRFGGVGTDVFVDIYVDNDKYVACGYANSSDGDMADIYRDTDTYKSDAIIVSYDKNGNLLTKKAFGSTENDYFNSIAKVSDGYIVSGQASASNIDLASKGVSGAVVVKYDLNLNFVDYIVVSSQSSQSIINDDGNLIVSSTGINSNGYSDGYLTRIDKNLNVLKSSKFDGGNSDNFQQVIKTANGYVVAGSTYSKGKTVYDVVDPYSFGVEDAVLIYYDKNLNLVKNFEKKIELVSHPKELVKNYGTAIPSYTNLENLELYTTNNPSKDMGMWCATNEKYYGDKDNYRYTGCLKPFNGYDILELYNYTNSSGVGFIPGTNDYLMNKNLDKVDLSNSWFRLRLYYSNNKSDLKLIFNGNKYTIEECVSLGYIEPLVIHGNNWSNDNDYISNDTTTVLYGGTLDNNNYNHDVYVYFKTKVPGLQGVSITNSGHTHQYYNLMLSAYRNFDISLSRAE